MEPLKRSAIFAYLPILALFCYWLYACVIGALVTGDPRLLKISFVSLPLVIAMAVSALKLRGRGGAAR
jgi:predicted branched-subunit amino acid permease